MSAQMIYGVTVHVEPLRQRYKLPNDVPPPTGMTREQFDEWSRRVCGYCPPLIADGQVLKTPYGLHMNAKTWEAAKSAIKSEGGSA